MRATAWLMTTIVVVVATATLSQSVVASPDDDAPEATTVAGADCPVSIPNGTYPPGHATSDGNFGNDALWTNLSMWSDKPGIVEVPNDERITPDGVIRGMKWAWNRFEKGDLAITGRRLHALDDPLIALIPDGYGDTGFQVSGLTFPSAGCWEITGMLNDSQLTFVVLVVLPPDWRKDAA